MSMIILICVAPNLLNINHVQMYNYDLFVIKPQHEVTSLAQYGAWFSTIYSLLHTSYAPDVDSISRNTYLARLVRVSFSWYVISSKRRYASQLSDENVDFGEPLVRSVMRATNTNADMLRPFCANSDTIVVDLDRTCMR